MIGWPSTATSAKSLSFVCENCGHRHGETWTGLMGYSTIHWSTPVPTKEQLDAKRYAIEWELGRIQRDLARSPVIASEPSVAILTRSQRGRSVLRPRRARRVYRGLRARPGMARIVRMQREERESCL